MTNDSQVLPLIQRVGIVANLAKPGADRVLEDVVTWLRARGITVWVAEGGPGSVPSSIETVPLAGIGRRSDILVSIGGDGTLITGARAVIEEGTPVLGINLGGKLGFLTELDAGDMPGALAPVLAGGLPVEERMNLDVRIFRGSGEVTSLRGLNDCALVRKSLTGILDFSLFVHAPSSSASSTPETERDEDVPFEHLGTFLADGVVVSTPTGSTAYCLSAGGPVLHPEMKALVLTPICAHTLSVRPVVFGQDQQVEVRVGPPPGRVRLTVDGSIGFDLDTGDRVRLCRSAGVTRLVRSERSSFYERLREKFEWGGHRSRRGTRLPSSP